MYTQTFQEPITFQTPSGPQATPSSCPSTLLESFSLLLSLNHYLMGLIATAQTRAANGTSDSLATKEKPGPEGTETKKQDSPDASGHTEFGGSWGMLAMMLGFPALMYYMWLGAIFYDGHLLTPAHDETYKAFLLHLVSLVKTHAYPSRRAWSIYWSFGLVQMAFYVLLPGVWRKGQALPHLGGKQLDYYCSAMWSFYTSIAVGLALHVSGYFKLYTLLDEFGPLMSVAILSGFLCSFIAYVSALARETTLRMSGYPIVDFFMGADLNPRIGILDFKMLLEVRIAWFILFFLALGTCLRQYEQYGYVSGQALFLLLAHYLYAGACSKGEHLIITSWYAQRT
jgi:delta24(24(1))-sterol reductase